jgi:membrane-associated phospholipid phosphatase
MTYLSPFERRAACRRALLAWSAVALLFAVVCLSDHDLYHFFLFDPEKRLERKDWWQVFRQFGTLWPWLFLSLCLWLHDAHRARHADAFARAGAGHRAVMVFLAAALGGGLAELLKLITRRARPTGDDRYHFGWTEHVDALGLASSHAGVAFGGAIMLGWFFPALRVPLLLLASATAMTRLAVGAHYTSDVFAAIVLSYAGCALLWRLFSSMPGGCAHPRTRTP